MSEQHLDCHDLCTAPVRLMLLTLVGMLIATSSCPQTAHADVVRLTDGGEIRGTIEKPKGKSKGRKQPESAFVTIRTVHGSLIKVARSDVDLIVKRRPIVEQYETKARTAAATIDAQWDLAMWCRQNHLNDEILIHCKNIIVLDPEHKGARKALDHIFRDGEWHSRAQYMQDKGYVLHKGRWITVEERDLAVKSSLERTAERKWHRKIHTLHGWLTGNHAARQKDAYDELSQLDDHNAIPALVKHFQNANNIQLRDFYVDIIQRIGGPASVGPLVTQGLLDVDKALRKKSFDAIPEDLQSGAAELLISQLRNQANAVILRAATALKEFGDESAILPLINSLQTAHKYRVRVPDESGNVGFGSDGSFSMGGGGGQARLTPELEMAMRSGQFPFGAIVIPPDLPKRTKVVNVRVHHKNTEVLQTLKHLTGQDFGFDQRAWKLWYQAFKSGSVPAVAMP